jgi:hypothetical protein
LKLSYVPLANNQFQRLDWGTEVLYSNSRYLFGPDGSLGTGGALSGDEFERSIGSVGMYSYLTYKWHRQWSAGFLFDFVENPANHSDHTFAYSPYITWALSHWNQIRLQQMHMDHNAVSGLNLTTPFIAMGGISGARGWQAR